LQAVEFIEEERRAGPAIVSAVSESPRRGI
jgi:hypothetical protein